MWSSYMFMVERKGKERKIDSYKVAAIRYRYEYKKREKCSKGNNKENGLLAIMI